MKTCKTCRHWSAPEPDDNFYEDRLIRPFDPDTYTPMKMPFEVRICRQPTQTFCEYPVESNGFGLADASNYRAVLATGEDFGCVRHEEIQ